jgi:transcriptional regulator with XRE-family HTH domain
MNITKLVETKISDKGIDLSAYESGLSKSTLSRYQNGKYLPRITSVERLAKWLGVSVADVVRFYSEQDG